MKVKIPNMLEEIVVGLKPLLEEAKQKLPFGKLREIVETLSTPKSFKSAFDQTHPPRIIGEMKKASPSKGVIREDFEPVFLAKELEGAGAVALSVLTEPNYFKGSLLYLSEIGKEVKIPRLRKDFIFDEYQIYEAKAAGASAVLLIAALLPQKELIRFSQIAISLGLDVLGEAHGQEEIERLLDSPVTLIGINARDLKTFQTDLDRVAQLIGSIPKERFPIAESAIRSAKDICRLEKAGAVGFLIGETLMRAARPGNALRELIEQYERIC